MLAYVIRPHRYGEPKVAFALEEVPVPALEADECLVRVMAAGINYNNVWASLGHPVDVVALHQKLGDPAPFHIGGSDASGIVCAVGESVTNVSIGDEVVAHCGWWPGDAGPDGIMDPRARIWGFEINYGSFAQFARVQAHALLPKPPELSWEEAAAYMLCGATAFRMLHGFAEHRVGAGDVVLIWGGAGGVGSMAIQLVREAKALPVAVASSDERLRYCLASGAVGVIDRRQFHHWGVVPDLSHSDYVAWRKDAMAFRQAVWDAVGERRNPRIVIEHPGETTMPTSCFVCDPGGMVVVCAGTSGYRATLDLRYHWMHQKRLQGSHFANDAQCAALNELVRKGRVGTCLAHAYDFDEIPDAHQRMYENSAPPGNSVARIGTDARFL